MDNLQAPETLLTPFANNGQKNEIPLVAPSLTSNAANLTDGFPSITMKPKGKGGKPPEGKDFNGILYLLSSFYFAFQNGWLPTFEDAVSDAIGGYAKGAVLWYTAGESRQALQSQKNANKDNFNTDPSVIGSSWLPIFPDLQTVLENMPIGLHVGDLLPNIGNEPPSGRMLCNGQRVANCQTLYPEFYAYVLAKTAYKTVAEFNAQVSQYGQCGYPAVDGADVILPLITRPISGVETLAQTGMSILDRFQGHRHNFHWSYTEHKYNDGAMDAIQSPPNQISTTRVGDPISDGQNGAPRTGPETRGKQVLYPYCVVVYTTIPDKATVDVGELVSLVKEQNQLGLQNLPATSGTIALKSGGIYKGAINGDTVFSLPAVSDASNFNQILIQLVIDGSFTVNFGTTYYLGEPPATTSGAYNLIYEYDALAQKWAVGSLVKTEG